jgi:hypothetical protein
MDKFSDVLLDLDSADEVQRIELFYSKNNEPAGIIHNRPGSAGSVKVYYHLYKTFGCINVDAAIEGLSLYAEHTEDAENNPRKHPNIERLFNVIEYNEPLTVHIVMV